MPAITVTCPNCNVTLKPKTPVPGGTRLKCPKCATMFVTPPDEGVAPAAPAPKPEAPKPAAVKPAPPADDVTEVTEAIDDEAAADAGPTEKAAAGGGFKDKLKKVPMWGWIVGGVVVLFLMCGCCGTPIGYLAMYGLGGSSAVTEANYKQLKKNMTEADVKKIMGGEASLTVPLGDIKSETWKGSGDDFITVQFSKDGKAIAGGFQFTNGPAKMSGGGPLP